MAYLGFIHVKVTTYSLSRRSSAGTNRRISLRGEKMSLMLGTIIENKPPHTTIRTP